jgi:hypothetical protein
LLNVFVCCSFLTLYFILAIAQGLASLKLIGKLSGIHTGLSDQSGEREFLNIVTHQYTELEHSTNGVLVIAATMGGTWLQWKNNQFAKFIAPQRKDKGESGEFRVYINELNDKGKIGYRSSFVSKVMNVHHLFKKYPGLLKYNIGHFLCTKTKLFSNTSAIMQFIDQMPECDREKYE